MMVIVLAGLAYDICEAYIDDLIVHGKTEEKLVENLRRFFTRLREYGIKLNPRLMGPFVIVNCIKDTYTCRNLVTEDNEDFHVSRLREFHFQAKRNS